MYTLIFPIISKVKRVESGTTRSGFLELLIPNLERMIKLNWQLWQRGSSLSLT
jgi:hypothetical protein